ncbi:TPA: hypothetical protein HIS46_004630 [Escherichia coli]|nr:hypothetical protein [Escherichia coli]
MTGTKKPTGEAGFFAIPGRVGGSGPGEVSFQLTLPEYRYIHLIAICSLQSIVPGVAISPETSIISKLALSGDLPSHQSIGTMDLCYSKTWPDKQVVLRLVLWPEEVSFQLTMKELL